ncbi:hypothetical protein L6164_034588 [Bauhinia variegata]|uniref:Uncharacterized protein n=1 Tax=Bauhinia variegata TaxID=167791 RepID=A0ACB9KVE6_BAUVA|nr:hypothetical protein L6164_034588 [Bauhinia variegata]
MATTTTPEPRSTWEPKMERYVFKRRNDGEFRRLDTDFQIDQLFSLLVSGYCICIRKLLLEIYQLLLSVTLILMLTLACIPANNKKGNQAQHWLSLLASSKDGTANAGFYSISGMDGAKNSCNY